MAKRFYICTERSFPRGDAGANYIQYFALALLSKGWKVTVLSCSKGDDGKYKDIDCVYIPLSSNKINHSFQFRFCLGDLFSKKLNELGCTAEDYIGFYTYSSKLVLGVMKSYKDMPVEHISIFCVEWYRKENYHNDFLGIRYRKYNRFFNKIYPIYGKIFAISTPIYNHFISIKKNVLKLPIMADPTEYVSDEDVFSIRSKYKNTIDFIYSGSADNKDSFELMLKTIQGLIKEGYKSVRLHLTGLKRNKLENILGEKDRKLVEDLGSNLVIHPWLEYQDLIELFKKIDFLLLPREDIFSNRANFPSKIPEMMSYGIIPICSPVGDYTNGYLFDKVNAVFINEFSVEGCINAARYAVGIDKDSKLQMALQCRKTVVNRFAYCQWSKTINQFVLSDGSKES